MSNNFENDIPKEEIRQFLLEVLRITGMGIFSAAQVNEILETEFCKKYKIYSCHGSSSPEVGIESAMYPSGHRTAYLDLRKYGLGDDSCQHIFITKEWEEGGGRMDSGMSFSYKICHKCGYHPTSKTEYLFKVLQKIIWPILLISLGYYLGG